jgi:hypothetical protein
MVQSCPFEVNELTIEFQPHAIILMGPALRMSSRQSKARLVVWGGE